MYPFGEVYQSAISTTNRTSPVRTRRKSHRTAKSRRVAAFSLIELVVVIAVISILIGLLMPAVQSSREAARMTSCRNNLKQVGIAISNFESQRKELPPSRNYDHYTSWAFLILPYMEQTALPDEWNDRLKYYYQSDSCAADANSVLVLPVTSRGQCDQHSRR